MQFSRKIIVALVFMAFTAASPARAYTLSFSDADFNLAPVFNSLTSFSITINIDGPLVAGAFNNPSLSSVEYSVRGVLSGTPSGFSGFNLQRSMTGSEFYAQGSSLMFVIDAGADLSDGLQIADLSGSDPVFVFDGREVGTGRYHPPLIELNGDGTGRIQNSNNFGGINPATNQMVDVDFGEEYIVDLSFDPAETTLSNVPEPTTLLSFGASLLVMMAWRRRKPGRS